MPREQFSAQTYNTKYANAVQKHLINRLKAIYEAYYKEAAKIGTATGFNDPTKEFYLKDFPTAEKKIEALLKQISGQVEDIINDGSGKAWTLSYEKNRAMIEELAARYGLPEERVDEWSKRNLAGLEAFRQRKEAGMNLSQRVWNFVKNDKTKLELALELGLAEGKSAAALSRDVRQYLNEPNKLFRRVRDKDGNLRLSKAAKAYHPGRGVYRSSYKNAIRMTMTEVNMAYRTADFEQWNKLQFVTGQIIKLSGTHPVEDMCDDLSNKTYPKEFKFVGWHPQCRCYVVAKMADRQELRKYCQMTDAEQAGYKFSGRVTEMPKEFTTWISENAERIENAASLPYFIRDNYVNGNIAEGLRFQQTPQDLPIIGEPIDTPAESKYPRTREEILAAADARHAARTQEQIYDIEDRWALREDARQYPAEQRSMFERLERALGITRGFSMPYRRADEQSANPKYKPHTGYAINCQTCAPAYQLRRWGFDVTAKSNTEKSGDLSYHLSKGNNWRGTWGTLDKKPIKTISFGEFADKHGYKSMTPARYKEYFNEVCKADGIYEIGVTWKGGSGHCTIVERRKGKLYYIEPQVSNAPGTALHKRWDMDYLYNSMTPKVNLYLKDGAIRCDNVLFDTRYAKIFTANPAVSLHEQRVLNELARVKEAETLDELRAMRKACNSSDKKIRQAYIDRATEIRHAGRNEDAIRQAWGNRVTGKIQNAKSLDELKAIRKDYTGKDTKIRQAFIDKAAELRHAERNATAIQNDWNVHRINQRKEAAAALKRSRELIKKYGLDSSALDNALAGKLTFTKAGKCKELEAVAKEYESQRYEIVTRKAAENVANVAANTPWIDQAAIDKLKTIKDVDALKKATGELAKEIAAVNKDIQEITKTIPNAKDWAKDYTSAQLHGVADAINAKINWIESNAAYYGGSTPLEQAQWKQKKINQEVMKLATDKALQAKYSTWKVSQAVYTEKYFVLDKEITLLQNQETLAKINAFGTKYPNSKVLQDKIAEAQKAYAAGDYVTFNDLAAEAEKKANKLENDRKRNARKSAKNAKPLGADFWSDSQDMLDFAKQRATTEGWPKAKQDKIAKLEKAIKAKDQATANELRKDLAIWVTGDPMQSYYELAPQTAKVWKDAATTTEEKVAIHAYTYTYHNINEPLRGLTYMGSPSAKLEGERRIPLITDLLERTSLEHDMWFQRGDGVIGLKKFGIDPNNYTEADIMGLVGKTGNEGAFWSAGSAKGKGFGGEVCFNIYAPKGTKGMYVEPFSDFGRGARSASWKGDLTQTMVGGENEYLIQRGTKFVVTKVEKSGGRYYVDLEIVEQDVLPFPYVGGYPFK